MIHKSSSFKKDSYTTGEVAKIVGVNPQTIILWDKKGKLSFSRTPTNRRVISKEKLLPFLYDNDMLVYDDDRNKHDVIYARVSTSKQKERGDLDRQVAKVLEYTNTVSTNNLMVLSEVGSGLNDNRKQLNKLIQLVMDDKVNRIFVSYKDRLTRFGYNYLETICKHFDVEIVIISSNLTEKTVQEELAEDLVSVIHSFSGKLYGLRKSKKKQVTDEITRLKEIRE